jgi:hypothetical protein
MNSILNVQAFPHKEMAKSYFNKVWELLEKENRSDEDNELMIHLCHSSFYHWTQTEDHTVENISIGYWQLSRVYAVLENGELAFSYGKRCMSVSVESNLSPFYIGYAYEAVARAYYLLKKHSAGSEALQQAYTYAEKVNDDESKTWLINDLKNM